MCSLSGTWSTGSGGDSDRIGDRSSRYKKYTSECMFYPGYVLVEMDMDDNVWHVVKGTPRVTGLLVPVSSRLRCRKKKSSKLFTGLGTAKEKPSQVKFEKNESVRITEGPFASFTGNSRGRSERRSRDVESDGDDLRALDSGGTRFRAENIT